MLQAVVHQRRWAQHRQQLAAIQPTSREGRVRGEAIRGNVAAAIGVTDCEPGNKEPSMLKFLGGTVGIIFIIGLIVVIGLFQLLF
ncbi:hypothetical protein OH686_03365 [Pseudomonas sp. SO81]|nr:hypothetical protein OH686_03365 [Pseudomonas sp. SO81]